MGREQKGGGTPNKAESQAQSKQGASLRQYSCNWTHLVADRTVEHPQKQPAL